MAPARLGAPPGTYARVTPPRVAQASAVRPSVDTGSQTRSLRYIGSKTRLAPQIAAILGGWQGQGRLIDAFCGTGVVGREAADLGWPVVFNDHLVSSVATASAQVIAKSDVPFDSLGGYSAAIARLEGLEGSEGFLWREYSPASARWGVERRYFTAENAARLDAMRGAIKAWQLAASVSKVEARLLIADLLGAANRVANIAGTYGCFLSHWTTSSLRQLHIAPRPLRVRSARFEASCLDVFDLPTTEDDAVYLDPPYTKRQYAAYYHLLETIAEGDAPCVSGVTGLRPWEHKASPFCYKSRALKALVSLVTTISARRVLISYSDDAHVQMSDLISGLTQLGDLRVHRLGTIGRYRPNEQASANRSAVGEYLLELHKPKLTAFSFPQRNAFA